MNAFEEINNLNEAAQKINEVLTRRDNKRSDYTERTYLESKLAEAHEILLKAISNIAMTEMDKG